VTERELERETKKIQGVNIGEQNSTVLGIIGKKDGRRITDGKFRFPEQLKVEGPCHGRKKKKRDRVEVDHGEKKQGSRGGSVLTREEKKRFRREKIECETIV